LSTGPGRYPEIGRYAAFAQVGFEMVAPVALGVWLDLRYDLLPWLTAVGALLGFGGGLLHIFVLLKQFEKENSNGPRQGAT
jgi:F0F1-type ATP synthase assembly protein I